MAAGSLPAQRLPARPGGTGMIGVIILVAVVILVAGLVAAFIELTKK